MTSSSSENDALHSQADGSYDISFFASSVRHSLAFSQEVFGKLSGGSFSSLAAVWQACAEDERRAFLLETHESAHHGLLFSTPAGVLLWRLNQVISRDIHYIGKTLRKGGVSTPADRSPRKWLNSVEFRSSVSGSTTRGGPSYLLYVIDELEKILKFRQIVFERQGPVVGQGMTTGEFIALANDVYSYLGDRCGLIVRGRWSTKRPLSSALFPENASFNVVDIAEVHAVAKELSVLRAIRDLDGVATRTSEFEEGPFGKCFRIAKRTAAMPNEIGFNPYAMQQLALLAFSTGVDLPQFEEGEHLIEEHLPWLVFCGKDSLSRKGIQRAFNSLVAQLSKPTIGSDSCWLIYRPTADIDKVEVGSKSVDRFQDTIQMMTTAALEAQVYLIHKGAKQNLNFLTETVKNYRRPLPQDAFDAWNHFLTSNKMFVEYDDGLWFGGVEFDSLFRNGHPVRDLPGFSRMRWPHMQIMGHILNGALTRRAAALYCRSIVPDPTVLVPKIARLLEDNYKELPDNARSTLKTFGEAVVNEILGKGRDLPFEQVHLRQRRFPRYV